MKTKNSELIIITKMKKLIEYIFIITEKSPKKYRFTLVDRMYNLSIDALYCLYKANNIKLGDNNRLEQQENARVNLQMLDAVTNISYEAKCVTFSQYSHIGEYINECLTLLSKWIKSDENRVKQNKTV